MVNFPGADGLSVKTNLNWIPEAGVTDNGKLISIRDAIAGTHIDQSTVRRAVATGAIQGLKIKGRYHVRLASYTRWVTRTYKYTKKAAFSGRNGRWWRKWELRLVYSDAPIREVVEKTGRSYRAVVIARNRLRVNAIRRHQAHEYPFFVSPHAVKQYQKRVLDVPAKYVIWNIQDGLRRVEKIRTSRRRGAEYLCRANHYRCLDFRAIVVTEPGRDWPVVATILEVKKAKRLKAGTRS